jgi:hypothetical protein
MSHFVVIYLNCDPANQKVLFRHPPWGAFEHFGTEPIYLVPMEHKIICA